MSKTELQHAIATAIFKSCAIMTAKEVSKEVEADYQFVYDQLKAMVSANALEEIDSGYVITDTGISAFIKKESVSEKPETVLVSKPTRKNTAEKIDVVVAETIVYETKKEIATRKKPDDLRTSGTTTLNSNAPTSTQAVHLVTDVVNSPAHYPAHYQGKSMQVFDVLDEFLSLDEVKGFNVGNVIKYVLRYKNKDGRTDLLKARDYLNRLIEATV